jgi:uncharacterized protein (TIGR01777 family)
MPEFVRRSTLGVSAERLFDWHASPGAFERLVPPFENLRVIARQGSIHDGDRTTLEMRMGPLPIRWVAEHQGYEEGHQFTDVQVKGPFARWSHTHSMEAIDEGHAVLEDRVLYRLPVRGIGDRLAGGAIRARLERTFAWRHARTSLDLSRHALYSGPPLRVAITGASGLVGKALKAFLESGGHRVDCLVRKRPPAGSTDIYWDPSRLDGEVDRQALEGVDVVVHLAGENVAGGRWTPARKAAILDSRRIGTRVLTEAIAKLERKPKVLISASAVGYYGDGGEQVFDERQRVAGRTFLAEVCQAWELASEPAKRAGVRTVNLRFGVVLAAQGGALAKMLPAFKLGGGGPLGSGRQWLSWIGLDDTIGAIWHAINHPELEGPVNAVAPQPVIQSEFASALGAVLHRPAFFPLPQFAVHMALGEMGQGVLLDGQRVVPTRLQETGFHFATPWLDMALRWELGEVPPALLPPVL